MMASLLIHPGGAFLYELTREPPKPYLQISISGEGSGIVLSTPAGIRCGEDCSMSVEPGSLVKLTATVGEGATFEGWQGPCGSQAHELFNWAANALVADISEQELEQHSELLDFLVRASEPPLSDYPLECEVTVDKSVDLIATFGLPPKEVEVAMLEDPLTDPKERPEEMTVALPKASWEPEELLEIPEEEIVEPEEEQPIPPPEPPKPIPPPLEAQPTPAPPPPQIAKAPKMKAVEVPDENEVEEAPDDAQFLSDKNRDVAEETHATETNLDKQMDGERVASSKSDVESEDIGGEEEEIAQLEDVEETSLDADRDNDESAGSEDGEVVMKHSGDDGEGGEDGEGGDDSPTEKPGLLSMRNIEGRGALGSSGEPKEEPADTDEGTGGKRGKRGKAGRFGPKLQLDQDDYERIVGKEVSDKEMAVARKKQSRRRGRWERKLGMLKSSLENFTPEVRPGNQTALKTRAAPFAVYIARMHRRIHEMWGFGFLEELDSKSSTHPMNNWQLWTKLEIVINPDGSIDKITIVKPSGVLPFDVAALDVIDTAGPYEPTPEKIRSADGKVYMHWAFHRDWRQCGTFGAEPFILSSPGGNRDRGMDDSQLLRNRKKRSPISSRNTTPGGNSGGSAKAASARANLNLASPNDPAAQHAANLWLSAFVAGNIQKMASVSRAPFRSGDMVVGNNKRDIADVYKRVLSELSTRRIRDWKLLSAAGYRKALGALPPGIDPKGPELFLIVRVKKDNFTLVLEPNGNGEYRVTGLHR